MATQSYELFALSTTTPDNSPFYGKATARAVAEAGATIHRGIDLSAGFDFRAQAAGRTGDVLAATFSGGAGLRVGLALQAMFPLDLFRTAGVVARLRAQAEASAFVAAALSLELDEFYRRVRGQVPAGPLNQLLEIFFEEVTVQAGLWARVAFSFQLLGQATFTGTLLPTAAGGPGFTFSLQYAMGWFYGTGYQFQANIGIEDPRRLLDRLAALMTDLTLAEVERYLGTLSPADASAAQPTLAVMRIVLPLSTRTVFQLGVALAEAEPDAQRTTAAASVVDSVIRTAQEQLLRWVIEYGARELANLLRLEAVLEGLLDLAPGTVDRAIEQLETLRDRLRQLDSISPMEVSRWLPILVEAVAPLEELAGLGALSSDTERNVREALALFWCAGVLVSRVVAWVDDPSAAAVALFGDAPATAPANSTTAAHVAARLGKPAGTALTLADLVAYLIRIDLEQTLRNALPEVAACMDWISRALNTRAGKLVEQLLVDLADPTRRNARQLLTTITPAVSDAVRNEMLPGLIEPIKELNADNPPLILFLDEVIVPTLVALPEVLLPRLAELGDEGAADRFREALSAVLLQSLQRFAIESINILLDHALTEGEGLLHTAADAVRDFGSQAPAYGVLTMAATHAVLPVALTPADAESLLRLAADLVRLWNTPTPGGQSQRELFLVALRTLVALGLTTDDTRAVALETISTTDDPPSLADLQEAWTRVAEGLWQIAGYATPRLLELIALHYWNEAQVIGAAIYEGVRTIIAALVDALRWLGEQLEELRRRLERLAQQIAQLAGRIAGDLRTLATSIVNLQTRVIRDIREAGAQLVRPLLAPLPVWARNALLDLYNALFGALTWTVTGPLQILAAMAGWVEAALNGSGDTATVDESTVHAFVRRAIRNAGIPDLSFQLRLDVFDVTLFDLGIITLPAGTISTIIADAVISDPIYRQIVRNTVRYTNELRAARTQEQATRQAYDGSLNEQQGQALVAQMVPGRPLQITLTSPTDGSQYLGRASIDLRIEGANSTFLQETMGVQPRVAVKLNGQPIATDVAQWTADATGINYRARVLPTLIAPAPTEDFPIVMTSEAELRRATGVSMTVAPRAERILFVPTRTRTGAAARPVAVPIAAVDVAQWASGGVRFERLLSDLHENAGFAIQSTPAPVHTNGAARAMVRQATQGMRMSSRLTPYDAHLEPYAAIGGTMGADGVPISYGLPGVNVLQVSVSDGSAQTQSVSQLFILEPGMPPITGITITAIDYDPPGRDVNTEFLRIQNNEPNVVEMTGWILRDRKNHLFRFPTFALPPGGAMRIWTGTGIADAENLYWGRRAAIWNNRGGDTAILTDSQGREMARFEYRGR